MRLTYFLQLANNRIHIKENKVFMKHAILLGDSIFDNAAYVAGGPDVCHQLRLQLPQDWQVTLLAEDGSRVQDIANQLSNLPKDTTHLVVSVGGNNATAKSGVLNEPIGSVAEALAKLAKIKADFQAQYHQMLQNILGYGYPTVLCTVYYPRYSDPFFQEVAVTALDLFNDVIIAEAIQANLAIIDLRFVCTVAADYANPIEPSVLGGIKIATVIARSLLEHNFAQPATVIYN